MCICIPIGCCISGYNNESNGTCHETYYEDVKQGDGSIHREKKERLVDCWFHPFCKSIILLIIIFICLIVIMITGFPSPSEYSYIAGIIGSLAAIFWIYLIIGCMRYCTFDSCWLCKCIKIRRTENKKLNVKLMEM